MATDDAAVDDTAHDAKAGDGDPAQGDDTGGDAVDDKVDWKAQARKWERQAKTARDQLQRDAAKAREAAMSDQEKAVAKAREEAALEATTTATQKANRRIVAAELKAAAGTRLQDPTDAVRLLDLEDFELDDAGELDPKAVAKAIDELLKSKPYLAAGRVGPATTTNLGGGRRDGEGAKPGVQSGRDLWRERHPQKTNP